MKIVQPTTGFTGRHMLLTMLVFFGVIITVNVTMAVFARTSWTGFVVANSYVASQEFNAKMAETRAQTALKWKGTLAIRDHLVRYRLVDPAHAPVLLKGVQISFKRPVDDREDHVITLAPDGDGGFALSHEVADGVWLIEINADAGLSKPYRETLRVHVIGGIAS
ncbi:FixH family protein [Mesorhizobium sp. ASY16-5R]|uniref:FixH family protein n=1 Tax=Mesorhizobium sp. ASY16-5R TaxID=3445772 RepID=UPI003F9F3B2B